MKRGSEDVEVEGRCCTQAITVDCPDCWRFTEGIGIEPGLVWRVRLEGARYHLRGFYSASQRGGTVTLARPGRCSPSGDVSLQAEGGAAARTSSPSSLVSKRTGPAASGRLPDGPTSVLLRRAKPRVFAHPKLDLSDGAPFSKTPSTTSRAPARISMMTYLRRSEMSRRLRRPPRLQQAHVT